jgi:hypothetical protein
VISLYGGRLKLRNDRETRHWHAHIRLSPHPYHQLTIDTEHVDPRQAVQHSIKLFTAFCAEARHYGVMCWDCVHWDPAGRGRCDLDIPEAQKTGGRFAAGCALFKPCPALKSLAP